MDIELIKEYVSNNTKMFLKDISSLQPKERAAAFIKLLDIISKEKEKKTANSSPYSHLTDEQLNQRLLELEEKTIQPINWVES